MENKLLDRIARTLNVELPHAETMDRYLDQIIPIVRPWSEDLREEQFYLERPWLELRDDVNFHKAILHFFNEGGEYLRSVDGNVSGGSWRYLEKANKLLIDHGSSSELFDLAFLDSQFFILDKHGDQEKLGGKKYTVFIFEPVGRRLEWRDAMELLFNNYRENNSYYVTLTIIILLVIAIIIVLSVW